MATFDSIKLGSLVSILEDGEPAGVGIVVDIDNEAKTFLVLAGVEDGNGIFEFSESDLNDVVVLADDVFVFLADVFEGETESTDED